MSARRDIAVARSTSPPGGDTPLGALNFAKKRPGEGLVVGGFGGLGGGGVGGLIPPYTPAGYGTDEDIFFILYIEDTFFIIKERR